MENDAHKIIQEIQAKAFKEGWDALAKKIMAALSAPEIISERNKVKSISRALPTSNLFSVNPFNVGTNSSKIYDYVKDHPGLRGSEIIKGSGVENKVGRTALHRMKNKGIAANIDGKWSIL